MKTEIKIIAIGLVAFFNFSNIYLCFGAEAVKEADKNANGMAFEQALKNYEAFRQKEQDEIAQKINLELNREIEKWVAQAETDEEDLIGTRLEQSWEKLALTFPISPAHYEYNLRDYKYTALTSDVVRTDSLTSPYKATARIKEELYVERSHSPDISDPKPYFFTVTTTYTLSFEYKQNKLELINTDKKITDIENSVPDEIIKPAV